jgi:excisionase family DNA binding protein
MSKLLTTKDVAAKLGISDTRVRQIIISGKLPAQKFGNVLLIQESDLKLLENRTVGRPAKPKPEDESATRATIKRATPRKSKSK